MVTGFLKNLSALLRGVLHTHDFAGCACRTCGSFNHLPDKACICGSCGEIVHDVISRSEAVAELGEYYGIWTTQRLYSVKYCQRCGLEIERSPTDMVT